MHTQGATGPGRGTRAYGTLERAVNSSMRGPAVTIQAFSVHSELMSLPVVCEQLAVGNKLFMASDAVFVNNLLSCFLYENNLRFLPQGENCCMLQAVFCFKEVFIEKIIMRYMTFVAGCLFTVGTMGPCCVLRSHNVAVNACLRLIAKISRSI